MKLKDFEKFIVVFTSKDKLSDMYSFSTRNFNKENSPSQTKLSDNIYDELKYIYDSGGTLHIKCIRKVNGKNGQYDITEEYSFPAKYITGVKIYGHDNYLVDDIDEKVKGE